MYAPTYLTQAGYSQIGSGAYSRVYHRGTEPYVYKLCDKQGIDGWPIWCIETLHAGLAGKTAPLASWIKIDNERREYIAQVEFLPYDITADGYQSYYDFEKAFAYNTKLDDPIWEKTRTLLGNIKDKYRISTDLCGQNVRYRTQDPSSLVINDPFMRTTKPVSDLSNINFAWDDNISRTLRGGLSHAAPSVHAPPTLLTPA